MFQSRAEPREFCARSGPSFVLVKLSFCLESKAICLPRRRAKRKAPPAPRPKRRRKTKAAPVEPVLSEYELGRRAKIKRNNKFLVSVGLLFPPKEALEDDEHPWWYMTAR